MCDNVVRLSLFYGEHLFWLLKYVLVSWVSYSNNIIKKDNPIRLCNYVQIKHQQKHIKSIVTWWVYLIHYFINHQIRFSCHFINNFVRISALASEKRSNENDSARESK